jgi:hypothetical protein
MKTLIFILVSFFAFGQKDTVSTNQNVVKIGNDFYIETKVISVSYKPIDAEMMRMYEGIEKDRDRVQAERERKEAERKEYVKLLKQAVKQGYKPRSDNDFDDKIYNRVLDKVKKEKL